MGTWTKESNEINDRPIYKKGSYYLAVSTGSSPSWVGGASTPGSGVGLMFGQSNAPMCPDAVSVWTYFSQYSGNFEDDDSLKVTCVAREYPHNHQSQDDITSFMSTKIKLRVGVL